MRLAIANQQWETAERYSRKALIENPNDPELLKLTAGVLAFLDRKSEAAQMLVEAARQSNLEPAGVVDTAIAGLMDVGEIYASIELLEESVEAFPKRDQHRQILIGFYNEAQRTEAIPKHLRILIQDRHFTLPLLLSTTETSSRRLSEKSSERLLQRNPADHRVRLSEAFLHLYRREFAKASEVLEDILQHHPDFSPAHAMYGQSLVGELRWDELNDWYSAAPVESTRYADYWLTLGDYMQYSGKTAEATRAYWEASQRDPNRGLAWNRLKQAAQQFQSQSDQTIGDGDLDVITEHAEKLLAIRDSFNDFTGGGSKSQLAAVIVAKNLFDAGRVWEAEAWSAIASTLKENPAESELTNLRSKVIASLREDQRWIAKQNPALQLDFSSLPSPKIDRFQNPTVNRLVPNQTSHDHVRLVESGIAWNLSGVGDQNDPSDPKLAPLIRSTGAGGGAIDFDLDGLCDLAVINAGGTMLQADSHPNSLHRNTGKQFTDVSDAAGFSDTHFGQGIAVGDFNEDGFPDVFVANLGTNLLYRNNGDGSFTDCSSLLDQSTPIQWSTSAAFTDINRDGISDLIVTQYCATVPELDQACPNKQGVPGPCHPMVFAGDHDQFFLGTADASFANVTNDLISQGPPGRGLGILAGMLDGKRLGIYVANDMTRNFYYELPDSPTDAVANQEAIDDRATASGLAVDGRSLAQASMGIAASDFDHDGDLDLYVTGFGREYNIYYEQIVPGLWRDETAKLGLVKPTLEFVAFGSQAIDLDNDGLDEIIVTNGNIGQFSEPGADRYAQPLQIFRRGGEGSFETISDDQWGSYFKTDHVGRAMLTADFNRDGLCDLAITHTRERIGLLVNQSKTDQHRIGLQLRGSHCSRNAIGAVVRFKVEGKSRTLWQLSGNGYLCANEDILLAGLGDAVQIEDVTVTWPDSEIESFGTLKADQLHLIIQNSGEAYELQSYQ
ncbi:FG-GAP-like repeat-containing protein [Stieleria sp. JC731]|uniref:FG-GAP-like repeat-containing protein n=1 Tax=Pirellulaceae TaxID=2691357 RepID=UPI001E33369C|nr:FG-GAP-like repeat-containing protein [Stieleria sp. JC731]MCC9602499.1 FG-GAP-like repeat-containing protein [Stieleria sp. JC731]